MKTAWVKHNPCCTDAVDINYAVNQLVQIPVVVRSQVM